MSPLRGSLGWGYRAQGEKINIPRVLGEGKKDEGGGGEQTLDVLKGILIWVTSRGGEGCLGHHLDRVSDSGLSRHTLLFIAEKRKTHCS